MNYAELRQALAVDGGTLTLTSATLTPNVADLLASAYAGGPVRIDGAGPGPGDGQDDTVVVVGTSPFLNVAGLAVELRAQVDSAGQAQVTLTYTLLGLTPAPGDWTFSRSFSTLPRMVDWDGTFGDPTTAVLDGLPLYDARYVVTTQAGTDAELGVALEPGINFVGRMHPTGVLAIAESVFGQAQPLTVRGTVRLPQDGETVAPLDPLKLPWQVDGVPGILLQADAGFAAGLGRLQFSGGDFQVYWPVSEAWLEQNPTWLPVLAYTGGLSIPSAGVSVDVAAPTQPGAGELLLLGQFQGVSLARLADLADLAGTGDLLRYLPDQLRQLGDALGLLQLTHAGVAVAPSPKAGVDVGWVSFTVGMPDLKWKVWDGHFEVDSIFCRFEVTDPFAPPATGGAEPGQQAQYDVTVYGTIEVQGVPVNVRAGSGDGFTLYAELAEKQTIPLKELVQTYAPELPAPGDLTVDVFTVAVAPLKYYSMALALASQPTPWTIEVGPVGLTVSDVSLAFTVPSSGSAAGTFGGTIAFGTAAVLTMRFDVPSVNFLVRGSFPEVRLSTLVSTLTNQALALPDGFDLSFLNSYVMILKSGQNMVFRFGTELETVGVFALEVRRTSQAENTWGYAAGLDLGGARVSSLQGLSGLSVLEDMFSMRKLLLVVSSFADPAFTFPDLAAFNVPQIAGGKLALPAGGGVIAGFNAYGEWAIDTGDRGQNLLKELLQLDGVVGITLQVGANPSQNARLYVSADFKLNNYPGLVISGQAGGQIQDGSAGVFLDGSLTVPIQSSLQTFSVRLAVVENGAFVSATMRGNTPVAITWEGITLFQVGNLAVEIGVDWEGIPTVGVAGTITSGAFNSSIAVLLDSAEPQKSLVAGALSDLSLKDVVDSLAGGAQNVPAELDDVLAQVAVRGTQGFTIPLATGDDLDNLKMDAVAAAFATQQVDIPSSIQQVFLTVAERDAAGQGTRWFLTDLTNRMRHYELVRQADGIDVAVEAQLYCAPQRTTIGDLPPFDQGFYLNGAIEFLGFHAQATIDVDPSRGVAVDGSMDPLVVGSDVLFSLKAAKGPGGPTISVATYTQPSQVKPELRPPHFVVNGQLEILGLSRSVYASLTTGGIVFDLKGDLVPAVNFDLNGHVQGLTDMGAGGAVSVGVGTVDLGVLGKVPIDTGVSGDLALGVTASDIYARLDAKFEFAGATLTLPRIDLDVQTAALANLVSTVYEEVKEFLIAFLKDAVKWAEYVAQGIIQGVEDVVQVLQDVFKKTEDEAKQIYNTAFQMAKNCAATTATAFM